MKIILIYEIDVNNSIIGTKNDAILTAATALHAELNHADSTDDVCNIFKVQIDPPFQGG